MLTFNECKAKALIIGRQLERIDWYNLTPKEAESYCKDKATQLGADENETQTIAWLAMNYVINR